MTARTATQRGLRRRARHRGAIGHHVGPEYHLRLRKAAKKKSRVVAHRSPSRRLRAPTRIPTRASADPGECPQGPCAPMAAREHTVEPRDHGNHDLRWPSDVRQSRSRISADRSLSTNLWSQACVIVSQTPHCSNAKTRLQSLFILMTVQLFCLASSYSAWGKVPTLVAGSPWAGP
jgi:hypothetical protein